jgi:hypothetical protein
MFRATAAAGAALMLAAAAAGADTATAGSLDWLSGTWCGRSGQTLHEEHWPRERAGLMLGVHRDTHAERLVGFEFLRIVARDGRTVYIAQPGGRPPTEFELAGRDARSVRFANPQHDFPKRIFYRLLPDGRLEAQVDDGLDDGRRQRWIWSRC